MNNRYNLLVYYFVWLACFFIAYSVVRHRDQRDRGDAIYRYNRMKRDRELDELYRKLKPGQRTPDAPEPKERPASEAPGRVVSPEAKSLAGGSPHGVGDERGLSLSIRQ